MTLRVCAHVIEERDRAAAAIMGQVLGAAPVVEAAVSVQEPAAGHPTLFEP